MTQKVAYIIGTFRIPLGDPKEHTWADLVEHDGLNQHEIAKYEDATTGDLNTFAQEKFGGDFELDNITYEDEES